MDWKKNYRFFSGISLFLAIFMAIVALATMRLKDFDLLAKTILNLIFLFSLLSVAFSKFAQTVLDYENAQSVECATGNFYLWLAGFFILFASGCVLVTVIRTFFLLWPDSQSLQITAYGTISALFSVMTIYHADLIKKF
jgi:hypothetical protein